ncbi:MAG: glycoside hydrolase [Anaerolineae bacterium]|nr:glycoside hydrolase [Anaerolineae bacterium]
MMPEPTAMMNAYLSVMVMDGGSIVLLDRVTGARWQPFDDGQGPLLKFTDTAGMAHVIDLVADADCAASKIGPRRIRIAYQNLHTDDVQLRDFDLTIVLELAADRAAVDLTIEALTLDKGMTLEWLTYPNHHLALRTTYDDGHLVVPSKQGIIIPTRFEVGYMRFQHNTWAKIADQEHTLSCDTGSLNMPWYGAVKKVAGGQSAMLCVVETPADAALKVLCNKVVPTPSPAQPDSEPSQGVRLSTLTPVWRGSQGQLSYPRRLRIEMIPGGSYVDLAKRYRQLAIANGRYRSLYDKVQDNPAVARLIGAPDIKIYIYTNRLEEPTYRAYSQPVLSGYERVHTTFSQVAEIAEDLHENLGVDRALMLLGGWIRAGYDREHPDVWPPAEKAGGLAGMRDASYEVTNRGYLFALHDNYQDMYPDAPSYDPGVIIRERDGRLKPGGIWDGGPCQLICSSQAIALAGPVLDEIHANTAVNAYYLDTTTAASLYECYSSDHPLTRRQDRDEKLKLLRWLYESGFVVGGEGGTDWAVGVCSFFEGLPGSSVGFFDGITGPSFGIAVPLFSLVYHDAVVAYWQHGQPFGREDHDNHFLSDMLSANPSSWVLVADQWDDLKPLVKEAFDVLGQLHRRTAYQQMTSHRFLTDDFSVQETTFEDGTKIVVNFGIVSFSVGEHILAPKGFLIEDPRDGIVEGFVNRHCRITRGKLTRSEEG